MKTPRLLLRNFENYMGLRRGFFWFVVVADVVLIGVFAVNRISFYTSEGYAKTIAFEIPIPERAWNANRNKHRRWGMSYLTFTSDPNKNREIFEFYDSAFERKGYVHFEEPVFESKGLSAMVGGGKTSYVKSMLAAAWVDEQKETLIYIRAFSKQEPISDGDPNEASEVIEVAVVIRPFSPWDEQLFRDRKEKAPSPAPSDSAAK